MKEIIAITALTLMAITANAQENKKQNTDSKSNTKYNVSTTINNKTLDLIIERLETTGKLEQALNRAIEQRIKNEKAAQARAALDQEKKNQENAKNIGGFSDKEHYLGDKSARYSIISYEDMECPFCKAYAEVPENAIKKLEDVNFVSRAHPLPFHMPVAAKEAVLAECVAEELGNEGYFQFTRVIFKNTLTNGKGLPPLQDNFQITGTNDEKKTFEELKVMEKSLFAVAKEVGVKDISKTLVCYQDSNTSLKLQTLVQYSASHGINGTPTTILKDNKTGKSAMLVGIMTEEDLIDKVNNFIKQP